MRKLVNTIASLGLTIVVILAIVLFFFDGDIVAMWNFFWGGVVWLFNWFVEVLMNSRIFRGIFGT